MGVLSEDRHVGYCMQRDIMGSNRLELQHSHLIKRQGWLLHPKVAESIQGKDVVRIADLATGTGIWAIDAVDVASNVEIFALDISSAQFPPKFSRPEEITFGQHDIFGPAPPEYFEYFDVIHIRLIVMAILDNDRNEMITNLLRMLKPGGYIQWEEVVGNAWLTVDSTLTPREDNYAFNNRIDMANGCNDMFQWLGKLPETFESHGMIEVEGHKPCFQPALLKQESDLIVWSLREAFNGLCRFPIPGVVEEMYKAGRELDEFVESGECLVYDWLVSIGRKPM